MGKFHDRAIRLARIGFWRTGKNPNKINRKHLIFTGIGIMTAMSIGAFFRGLL